MNDSDVSQVLHYILIIASHLFDYFMKIILTFNISSLTPQQKGWPMYAQLLTALFKFLSPFLR